MTWNKNELRDDVEKAAMFSLSCGNIEAGKWRLTVEVANVEDPYIYEVDMLFLDLQEDMTNLGTEPDLNTINLLQVKQGYPKIILMKTKISRAKSLQIKSFSI